MQAGQELATKTLTDMFYPMGATSTALGDAAALLVEVINEYKGSNASLEASLQIVSLHLTDKLSNRLLKSALLPVDRITLFRQSTDLLADSLMGLSKQTL